MIGSHNSPTLYSTSTKHPCFKQTLRRMKAHSGWIQASFQKTRIREDFCKNVELVPGSLSAKKKNVGKKPVS